MGTNNTPAPSTRVSPLRNQQPRLSPAFRPWAPVPRWGVPRWLESLDVEHQFLAQFLVPVGRFIVFLKLGDGKEDEGTWRHFLHGARRVTQWMVHVEPSRRRRLGKVPDGSCCQTIPATVCPLICRLADFVRRSPIAHLVYIAQTLISPSAESTRIASSAVARSLTPFLLLCLGSLRFRVWKRMCYETKGHLDARAR